MTDKYHQTYRPDDGSIAVRDNAGDPWRVIKGGGGSSAQRFANQQNKFWKPWMKESVINQHDDEDDTFARRVKKPK